MKIALINGSPKVKESSSRILLEELKSCILKKERSVEKVSEKTKTGEEGKVRKNGKVTVTEIEFHTSSVMEGTLKELSTANAWVFACPLYVEGIPAHLLSCLVQMEKSELQNCGISVYGIVNCGFYEGIQAEFALKILQNWCAKAGFVWGGGIGVGGGGGLAQMPKVESGKGPRAPIEKALGAMADTILRRETQDNCYVSVAFPRFLYKMAAQMGWRQSIRANGGKRKALGTRIE